MPKFRKGNMRDVWNEATLFLITTNSIIKNDGTLVMGAGIAKQAKERFPSLPSIFGEAIIKSCGSGGRYGLIFAGKIGAFQTNYDWRKGADLSLIQYSATMLIDWIKDSNINYGIHLNYPGIGYGRLSVIEVAPIIYQLPDCVTIWSY